MSKRLFKIAVCTALLLCIILNTIVFANGLVCVHYDMEHPKAISDTLTQYTPWFRNFHLLTEERKAAGKRGGMGAQRIMCYDVSPHDANYHVAGIDTNAICISTDGGNNWAFCSGIGIKSRLCVDVRFDPYNEGVVYAVIMPGYNTVYSSYSNHIDACGIFKSYDNGWTWEQVYAGIFNRESGVVPDDLICFDAGGNVYAYAQTGVVKSSDGGETWENLGAGLSAEPSSTNVGLWVSDDGQSILAASSEKGVLRTADGGKTWESAGPVVDGILLNVVSFAVDPDDSSHWYITEGDTYKGYLFETCSNGTSWENLGMVFPGWKSYFSGMIFGAENKNGIRRMFISGVNVSKGYRYSDNGGRTWKEIPYKQPDQFARGSYTGVTFAVNHNDNNIIYSAGDISICVSYDNGDSWYDNTGGYSGHCVRNFSFDSEGRLYGAMHDFAYFNTNQQFIMNEKGDYPVTVSMHDSATLGSDVFPRWNGSQTCGDVDVDPRNPDHIMASTGKYGDMVITESTDGGKSWSIHESTSAGTSIGMVRFHSTDHNTIYSTNYTSRDGGQTWISNGGVILYDVCDGNNDYIIGLRDGTDPYTHFLCRSTDCGQTWSEIYVGYNGANDIQFDISNPDIVWMAGSGCVIKASFATGTYTRYKGESRGLGTQRLYRIAQNPFNPSHLLTCGTPIDHISGEGLFESTDYGESWHVVPGSTIGAGSLYSVIFSPYERVAIIGSYMGTFIYNYDEFFKYSQTVDNPVRTAKIYSDNTEDSLELRAAAVYNGAKYNTVQSVLQKDSYDPGRVYKWVDSSNISLGTICSEDGELLRDVRCVFNLDLSKLNTSYIKSIKLNFTSAFWSSGALLKINRYIGEDWDPDTASYSNLIEGKSNIFNSYSEVTVNRGDCLTESGDTRTFSVDVTEMFNRSVDKLDIICTSQKVTNTIPVYHDGAFIKMNGGKNPETSPYFTVEYNVPSPSILSEEGQSSELVNAVYKGSAYAPDGIDSLCLIFALFGSDGKLLKTHIEDCTADKFGKAECSFDLSDENLTGAKLNMFVFYDINTLVPVYKKKTFGQ